MSFEVDGFDDIVNELDKLKTNAENLEQQQNVPINDLLTKSFMSRNSSFNSFDDLIHSGNFDSFEQISDSQLDQLVSSQTKFNTWNEMLEEATDEYITKQLGL